MIKNKILELINNKDHYTIDKYILKYAKEFDLDINSFVLLIYCINQPDKEIFNYKKMMEDLGLTEEELMNAISALKDKKLIAITMEKNSAGILEEIVDTSSFYEIIASKLLNDNNTGDNATNIYDIFEEEFGRTLSPIEYDIINNWIESGINEELIKAALKETVFNGVNNLRYVDKILYEWNKKGIKTLEEISKKTKKDEEEKDIDNYDFDWLNE